jgi:hypothetical protein
VKAPLTWPKNSLSKTKGFVRFRVASAWKGQTRSEARVKSYVFDGTEIPREFSIVADEPPELNLPWRTRI